MTKYKIIKEFTFIITCILMLFMMTAPAFAESSYVIFEGEAEKFVFVPDTTDLFQNMKDLMPGDSVSQDIIVKNIQEGKSAKIYLRAEPIDDDDYEFLNYMKLTIKQDNNVVISESLANEQGELADNILLGTFKSGEQTVLSVTLDVDISMGNPFQMNEGKIIWVFSVMEDVTATEPEAEIDVPIPSFPEKIEETTAKPSSPNNPGNDPKTNDNTKITIVSIVFALCFLSTIFFMLILIKKNDDKDKEYEKNMKNNNK